MSRSVVEARDPVGLAPPRVLTEPNAVAPYLMDASRFCTGHTPRVYLPTTVGELAWVLRNEERVLPVGAQSSLTGGATPHGEAVVSLARMNSLELRTDARVWAEPGLSLLELHRSLAEHNAFYPPAPTFLGASVGGTVSTNAAGAATWKYGSTRDWVEALTVVLASGHVLELERGQICAGPERTFTVRFPGGGECVVPVPAYRMPDVPKRSAGYFAADGMDLVDLFVGSEGTLGIVASVELRIVRPAPALAVGLVPFSSESQGVAFVRDLRRLSQATWSSPDPLGIDIRALESFDGRSIELVQEAGLDRDHAVSFPPATALALVIQQELPVDLDAEAALEAFADGRGDGPLHRLCRELERFGVLDVSDLALPSAPSRQDQLFAVREAVPHCVNHRIQEARLNVDARIQKVSGDMIVPFSQFETMLAIYRRELSERGLDYAIWGHISDGNVHPNVLAQSYADVERGHQALLACGREAIRLGGCPLSEHGTGRSSVKQALLRELYGPEGEAAMRRVKQALDPTNKLAPGLIFP